MNTARPSPRYNGKTRGCYCSHELLMMGGRAPEICWGVNGHQDNKLENCCIWLVIYLNWKSLQSCYFSSVCTVSNKLWFWMSDEKQQLHLCLLKALGMTWHSLQFHLVLIGTDLNSPMEYSPCFDNSTCCSRSREVSGTLSLTPLLSILWGLQHRNNTSQGWESWDIVQIQCIPVC